MSIWGRARVDPESLMGTARLRQNVLHCKSSMCTGSEHHLCAFIDFGTFESCLGYPERRRFRCAIELFQRFRRFLFMSKLRTRESISVSAEVKVETFNLCINSYHQQGRVREASSGGGSRG